MISFLILILSALLQATLLHNLKISYAVPDILLVNVIFYALRRGQKEGIFFGIISGFLKGILSGSVFGADLFGFTVCGYFLGKQKKKIYVENKITHFVITFSCAFFVSIMNYIFLKLTIGNISAIRHIFIYTMPYCLYTAIVGIFLLHVMFKYMKR